jgi:hypothetical protein
MNYTANVADKILGFIRFELPPNIEVSEVQCVEFCCWVNDLRFDIAVLAHSSGLFVVN